MYMGFPRSKNHCVVVVDASRAWRVHNCKAKSREPEDRPPFLLTVDGRCGPCCVCLFAWLCRMLTLACCCLLALQCEELLLPQP